MPTIPLRRFRFARTDENSAVDTDFDDSGWDLVWIPHDWAIGGAFAEEHDLQLTRIEADGETTVRRHSGRTGALPHVGTAVYRSRLPDFGSLEQKRVIVDFDGVMSHSEVFVNGQLIGKRPYGYIPFEFDISHALKAERENLLAVRVNNPGFASRWYPGAGIYRHARLHVLPSLHVIPYRTRVRTEVHDDGSAHVGVLAEVRNLGQARTVNVRTRVTDAEGLPCAEATTDIDVETDATVPCSLDLTIAEPRLWHLSDPACYRLEIDLVSKRAVQHQASVRFGIRTIEFSTRDGFRLNGQVVHFKGVCLHHDLGPLGAAVNRRALEHRLEQLQAMGCNAIRTAHNPAAPELLDLCDEMGFLVIEEAFDEWRLEKVENGYHTLFDGWAERDLREMIRRHANHPSVVLWSIGNEIGEQRLDDGYLTARELVGICHSEDSSRPVTAGMNISEMAVRNGFARELDVLGFNYTPDRYGHYRHLLPDYPMYGSETASTVSSRGVYHFPLWERITPSSPDLQCSSYDLDTTGWCTTPDQEFRAQDEHPSIMGEFVWTGFDYLGEPTPYGAEWPSRSSYFGIIDLCGLPKDRYYLYQSRWSDTPVLHLAPHWTWPEREGWITPVQCYTSFDRVELFLNGRSLGVRQKSAKQLLGRYRLIWPDVVYEPGTLKAVAYDEDGQTVMERELHTAGKPFALHLVADRTRLATGGDDLAFVTARIVDRDGNLCPRDGSQVRFALSGAASVAAVGSGDPTSTEPYGPPARRAFNGMCVAIVRTARDGATGPVDVSAEADGVETAHLSLTVVTPGS